MAKKSQFDVMKYVPIGVMAVSLVSGYTLLQARVSNAEAKNESQDEWLMKQSSSNQELKIATGRMEEKMNGAYAILQELRADMKEDNRRGR